MTQHSAQFVTEMKQRLSEEKTRLEADLSVIASKKGAKFPDYGRSDEDNATEIGDYTATAATETALTERLHSIEDALQRIEEQSYGVTAEGALIPEERLKANPAATTLVIQ